MSIIKFNLDSFEPVPAGIRRLEIVEAAAVPSGKPSKIDVTFKDVDTNRKLKNSYRFDNKGGLAALGFLCRTALSLPDMGEFDTADTKRLVGKILECEVAHSEGTQPREDGSLPIFANIKKVNKLLTTSEPVTSADIDNVLSANVSPRATLQTTTDDLD